MGPHPCKRGKHTRPSTGVHSKTYNPHDVISPIVDSMSMMYHRSGHQFGNWGGDESFARPSWSADELMFRAGCAPAPAQPEPETKCANCGLCDVAVNADKSHLVCRGCGAIVSPIRVATDREKNCLKEDDKTTHADKPYEPKSDRYDVPARSCSEIRKEREYAVVGSRIGRKAKQVNNLGWAQEYLAREAARAERERQEMHPKDQTKGNQVQWELEKLFGPLEPMHDQTKRFFRMQADRVWRKAVAHERICKAGHSCQLRLKRRTTLVIADAVLACSVDALVSGKSALQTVTHAAILATADRFDGLRSSQSQTCGLRAVRTVVSSLMEASEPIPSCPTVEPSLLPFSRPAVVARSSEPLSVDTLFLRESVQRMFRALGAALPISTRDASLCALEDANFHAVLTEASGGSHEGAALAILLAVAHTLNPCDKVVVPGRLRSRLCSDAKQFEAVVAAVAQALPKSVFADAAEIGDDGLFG